MIKISSRTPDGSPNDCPICGTHVRITPSIDSHDAPCPACGHLLWFDHTGEGPQRMLTTSEAARVCRVSQQTIIRCFDSGQLHGYRDPATRRRLIPQRFLAEFMDANGIPVPDSW